MIFRVLMLNSTDTYHSRLYTRVAAAFRMASQSISALFMYVYSSLPNSSSEAFSSGRFKYSK